MRRQTSLLAIIAISVAFIAPTAMAEKGSGTIKDMHPPGNDGSVKGVGHIDGGLGRPYFVFHTPGDVAPDRILAVGNAVTFDVGRGRKVTNVSNEGTAPLPDTGGTGSVALGLLAVAGFCRGRWRRGKGV